LTAGGASASGGDSVQITKSSDKLNLGNGLVDIWGTSITKSDLKTVLADGVFNNKQNTEYEIIHEVQGSDASLRRRSKLDQEE